MTLSSLSRCLWCGRQFRRTPGPGRPPLYCRRSHRQRAFEARHLAARHGLSSDDVLLSRSTLSQLADAIYVLEAAMEDIDNDLAEAGNTGSHQAALWQLYGAAAGLRALRLEPKAVGY
ncbi:MAG: hypothetical protein ACT4OP_04940 [Actinomycetota bacterium]